MQVMTLKKILRIVRTDSECEVLKVFVFLEPSRSVVSGTSTTSSDSRDAKADAKFGSKPRKLRSFNK